MSCWATSAIIGFFFIAGTVFFEKQERTLGAVISTPLRFWEYLSAKLTLLVTDLTVRGIGRDDGRRTDSPTTQCHWSSGLCSARC